MTGEVLNVANTPQADGQKPLLRGWFHAAAAVAAVVVTVLLVWLSHADWTKMLSMLVFGLSMVELYTVSAVYHMGKWRPQVHRVLRALDHSNILFSSQARTPHSARMCWRVHGRWQFSH